MYPVSGNLNSMRLRAHGLRRGFTLLEILLVLAVLVVITALAVPAATSVFSGQQLRTAADVIRARFADCRVRAIKSGDVYSFFYKQEGGDYWLAPVNTGFKSLINGSPPSNQHLLENEVIFIAGETMQDGRSRAAAESVAGQFLSFRPILFYPDGTSQDAVVFLQSRNGLQIEIKLRGLTGVATKSQPLTGQGAQ
jgi:prepilin-type N-terminal cleavage/methylation domain-containing protein